MRFKTSAASILFALGLPVVASAQERDTLSLVGRNVLQFGIGLTGTREASATPSFSSSRTTGEVGSFGYTRWVRPEVAFSISASVINAEASASFASSYANVVTPILFGVSYSPRALALTRSLRPYVSGAIGPYINFVDETVAFSSASYSSEAVAGGRAAIGANWFAARHFLMSIEANYNAVAEFERANTVTRDPSGFGFSLGFGFSWGGRY